MVTARRLSVAAFGTLALAAALAYLHDPPWLAGVESGFRAWEAGPDGVRGRWIGGHASFFVSAEARTMTIPVRTTFEADPPIEVRVSIDDRAAAALVLRDDAWHDIVVLLPEGGSRRVRRVDLRANRTRTGNRGVEVGEITSR